MSVTVQIPSPLLRYSDGLTRIEVEGETLGEAFDDLFRRLPDLEIRFVDARRRIHPYLIVLLGSEEVPRDAWRDRPVAPGDVVDVVPAVEGGSGRDVRMRGFATRTTFDAALVVALEGLGALDAETVDLDLGAGRVLAEDLASEVDVPSFDRAAMDGFAIRGEDSFGASLYDPVTLEIVGEALPGGEAPPPVAPGRACRIMTGAGLPPGADAVVRAEDAVERDGRVEISAPATPGRHVGRRGEDVAAGVRVLPAGRRLRPQDLGILASIGRGRIPVVRRPRVGILVTGDELLPPGSRPEGRRIVDSNTPMLTALAVADGAELVRRTRLRDDPEAIRSALAEPGLDVLLTAGGSSVGREDWIPRLVAELGALPVHGVAMRPSSPTGIGLIGSTRVFLLPGNPVSCLCAYESFAGPAIRRLGGLDPDWPHARLRARLSRRIASLVGRWDFVRVAATEDGRVEPLATSGASILSSTTRAVGFVIVPEDSEGRDEGEEVEVFLFDRREPRA